jgi:broad specificity phosphatase PhoE
MNTRRPALALLLPVVLLLALSTLAGCAANGSAPRTSEPMLVGGTVYLARHAETVGGEGEDRYLGEPGRARAEALADALEGAGIQRVFSTDFPRTRETAAPIAERLGLEVELYDPRELAAFAERLLSMGQTVLVVGHSNTTPELVELLGGAPGPPIDEPTEHDRLYRVEVPSGETTVTRYAGPS